MKKKYLLLLFFTFGLVFDASCVLRFTLEGVPHCITTGKHISVKWPEEIEKIRNEGNLLLQMVQAKREVSAKDIKVCIEEIENVINSMLLKENFNALKINDKFVIGHLCNLKDKLVLLLSKRGSDSE